MPPDLPFMKWCLYDLKRCKKGAVKMRGECRVNALLEGPVFSFEHAAQLPRHEMIVLSTRESARCICEKGDVLLENGDSS